MAEKISCGGFYVGDGLKMDAATRSLSTNGGSTGGGHILGNFHSCW